MDLYSLIREIFEKKDLWEYKPETTHWGDVFNADYCHDFVESYFGQAQTLAEPGSLAGVLQEEHFWEIDSNRYQHIVFTFFLGLVIYHKCATIKSAIDAKFCDADEYENALEKHKKAPFAYLWFLICLFHDLGYQFENNNKNIDGFATFEELKSHVTLKKYGNCIKYLDELKGVPDYFTFDLIANYYKFRNAEMHKIDHGITGGMYLFRDLCSIRKENYKKTDEVKKGWWKTELEDIFRLASSIVLCHNIFLPDTKDYDTYRNYGLGKLKELAENARKSSIYPFKMEDYPIFFLFCLVDTLEPIKVVKNVDFLKHIIWDFQDECLVVKSELKCGCHNIIMNNASSLSNWLCNTSIKENGEIKISF